MSLALGLISLVLTLVSFALFATSLALAVSSASEDGLVFLTCPCLWPSQPLGLNHQLGWILSKPQGRRKQLEQSKASLKTLEQE